MTHIHLIGIGGSGLSAIALLLLESGYRVSGSDRQVSPLLSHLERAGTQVFYGHRPENVAGADLVLRSSAVTDDNVEVQAARSAGIPVLKRADFLGQLLSGQTGIAVAGTHGKTTTTAMIAWVLTALGKDPSYIIGGVSANLGSNAHAGKGGLFVIEADEYDRMFLGLRPQIAVVTNIEHDHPDCYPTPEEYFQAFEAFVNGLQSGEARGDTPTLIACSDDPGAARLLETAAQRGIRTISYGLQSSAGYTAQDLLVNQQGGYSFTLHAQGKAPTPVALQAPGKHNVCNALAALAVMDSLGFSLDRAAAALGEYRGTGRRFELRGEAAGVTVIDDYAHHPTEIRATLEAAQARFAGRPLWAVWQPHTYSRTRTLAAEFVKAFIDPPLARHILVTEIYASRESAPADGFSSRQLVEEMQTPSAFAWAPSPDTYFAATLVEARDILLRQVQPGDVVLVFSAGDADWISTQLLQTLSLGSLAASDKGENYG